MVAPAALALWWNMGSHHSHTLIMYSLHAHKDSASGLVRIIYGVRVSNHQSLQYTVHGMTVIVIICYTEFLMLMYGGALS